MRVQKVLSDNDVGLTGGHQAGILIPKLPEIRSLFPALDARQKNPRARLLFRENSNGAQWTFNFIYYNNRLFGGTRNEFRLTGMTEYLRAVSAKPGDSLAFSRDSDGSLFIDCLRAGSVACQDTPDDILVLRSGWKYIAL